MTICNTLGCNIEMINTTGAIGAAMASRIGIGEFDSPEEAIDSTQTLKIYTPDNSNGAYQNAFEKWQTTLEKLLSQFQN